MIRHEKQSYSCGSRCPIQISITKPHSSKKRGKGGEVGGGRREGNNDCLWGGRRSCASRLTLLITDEEDSVEFFCKFLLPHCWVCLMPFLLYYSPHRTRTEQQALSIFISLFLCCRCVLQTIPHSAWPLPFLRREDNLGRQSPSGNPVNYRLRVLYTKGKRLWRTDPQLVLEPREEKPSKTEKEAERSITQHDKAVYGLEIAPTIDCPLTHGGIQDHWK